jgi:phosphate transport system substrate-binding protein
MNARDEATTTPLHVQSGSEFHRVLHEAAITWNLNPKVSDRSWGAELDTASDIRLADYFCRQQGLEPTGERSTPPVPILISHSDPTAVVRDLAAGRIDLGDTGYTTGAISESLAIEDQSVSHPVTTAGSAFVVSPPIIDGGVTSLRAEELRDIYGGKITNWKEVGGPDREIRVIAGPDANPPRWLMDTFFDGVPEAGVDERRGREATRVNRIESRNDAVGEVPVGLAVYDIPALDISVDGTRFSVSETGYPATVDLACYSWGEPNPQERAFVSYLQSPAGQRYVDRYRDFLPLNWQADS